MARILIFTLLMACCHLLSSQNQSILFVNGTAHLGNGERLDKCAIGIENGLIKEVFNANVVDPGLLKYDTVIDIAGQHIYPGFIAANSNLGLIEIGAVRATKDDREVGSINPNIRSLIAYNAESKITGTVRSNGVLVAQITPKGGLISGTSSIVQLDAWNWEDAVVHEDDGIHLNWPRAVKANHPKAKDLEQSRLKRIEQLTAFFKDADAYRKASYQYELNLKFEAMKGLFEGKKTLYLHVNTVKEITEAIYFTRSFSIGKLVIVGGYDAWRIPELLNDNHASVILRRIHSLPMREDEDIDLPFKIPSLLQKSGVLFCFDADGSMGPMQIRNLPFYAGTAMTYGLSEEEAVQSLTLNAAKILGIDQNYGSLEVGKQATLFVSEGNALDMRSNKVLMAMIDGRWVNLNNHQKELYKKYTDKYKSQSIQD